jgi:signal transduction histidine kinase/CheY-like chemotaxis protein
VSSLDYEATLATVAGLSVPMLADWCVIDVLDPASDQLRHLAVAHVDPGKIRFVRELRERFPASPGSSTGVWEVIRTGRPVLLAQIPDSLLESASQGPEHLRVLRELGLRSAMILPLRVRGRTIGAMSFVHAESERRYTEGDLAFAEDFARRAGMAVENATMLSETEVAEARERLLRSEAETANRAKDEFLATVSHELRTPLNAILGWTVILRGRHLGEEVDRALAVIERNARAQSRLIDDVLDLSRIVSGKMVLRLGATNVGEAVGAAVETVSPAAEAKDIAITSDLPREPVSILADADRLQQIVWNLLSNAVKFTPKGGTVAVTVQREDSDVCIRVKDTGEGIPSEMLPFLFEPFRQADASTTRRHGGLGLGLSIVKRLVDAHGGSVAVKSAGAGQGSAFTVKLPARALVGAVAATGPSPAAAGPRKSAAGPRLDGLRVLVVDDEADAREVVSEVLSGYGAEVHVVGSASEALERFTTIRPDVLVSDVAMPGADGHFLIRKVRSLPQGQGGRTPAVALTAYARSDDEQRAFAAGYQMHVPKPVEPVALATVVANLGGRSLDDGVDTPGRQT